MSGVYEGLTVIELADRRNQWAGKLLSDGGARVMQIEPIDGSPGRWTGPFVQDTPDADNCLDYWFNNTGKHSVALYTIKGGGHSCPHPAFHGQRLLGNSNRDIHAANEIWEFFQSVP